MNRAHCPRSPFLLFMFTAGLACAAQPAKDVQRSTEARWMTEDTSSAARYDRSKQEANAAYGEAMKRCGRMTGADMTACVKESKANLQNDLAYAKRSFNHARQLIPLSGPVAKYNDAVRDAYAAYGEASNDCGSMSGREKAACIMQAKARIQNNLAYAKARLTVESGAGNSGATDGTRSSDATADHGGRYRAE